MTLCMCILIPPIGVAMKGHDTGNIILNLVLWLLGFHLVGMIHALVLPDKSKEKLPPSVVVNLNSPMGTSIQGASNLQISNPEKQILEIARTHPVLTVRYIVMKTNLTIEEAEETLKYLANKHMATIRVDENGNITYNFSSNKRRTKKLTEKQVLAAIEENDSKITSYELAQLTVSTESSAKDKLNEMTVDGKLRSYVTEEGQIVYTKLGS